jgi:hypothetical protein
LDWIELEAGFYKYAIKAIYTNDIFSDPSFSNMVEKIHIPDPINVTINVHQSPGIPIASAQIILAHQNGTTIYEGSTNETGQLIFEDIMEGIYHLSASKEGFYDYEQSDINITESLEINVNMEIITGLEMNEDSKVHLFPNPAQNQVNILSEKNVTSIEIYDMIGRVVHTSKPNNNSVTIQTEQFPKGIFHLKVWFEGERPTVLKLIIN